MLGAEPPGEWISRDPARTVAAIVMALVPAALMMVLRSSVFADLPAKPDVAVTGIERPRDWRAYVMAFIPLIALGFNIIFKATDAINFAQGEWVMMGGMVAAALYGSAKLPLAAACVGAVAIVTAIGLVSERIVIRPIRKPTPLLANLPGYPARLTRAVGGGAWLTLMAPRNRLVELVLTERAYREDMVANVDRDLWIAPQMSSGNSFLEPLQCGGVVTMGVRKPWAPGRSYGLVARLDSHFRPVASLHSRADGRRHGIKDVVEIGGVLFVASRGGNAILDIETGVA